VWDRLTSEKATAFPFPPHHRIPNFRGAPEAARRLFADPIVEGARRIKVNPDAPQRYVRRIALERGIVVYMPSPRLRSGFLELDPGNIPADQLAAASTMSRAAQFGREVPVSDLPEMDLVITGCVAVTEGGSRCGKGHGYSDLEYAVLRELGHPPVPVLTTVHDLQVVAGFPSESHDLVLDRIFTPTRTVAAPGAGLEGPSGIDWAALAPEDLESMPVLGELAAWRTRMGASRFWEEKSLSEMTDDEWEALCDGCGRCCLLKLREGGVVAYTDVHCRVFDQSTCRCRDYPNRAALVPDCVTLGADNQNSFAIMPTTCAYRRIWEGRGLPSWHPLLSGSPASVHTAGISIRNRAVSEARVNPDDLVDRLVDWISTDEDG
jgi:5-formyltetrahydrofolate cyclo-ligase